MWVLPATATDLDRFEGLRSAKVSLVYSDARSLARAVEMGDDLGVPVEIRLDLPRLGAADPVPEVLDDLADLHRGEAVALVLDVATALVLDRDSDGWSVQVLDCQVPAPGCDAHHRGKATLRLGRTIRGMGKKVKPKSECCVSKDRCKRCPIRMMKDGTLPPGYTVKKRKLVKVDKKQLAKLEKKKLAKVA